MMMMMMIVDVHHKMIVSRQTSFIGLLSSQLSEEDPVGLEARDTLCGTNPYGFLQRNVSSSVFYQQLHMGVYRSWVLQEQFNSFNVFYYMASSASGQDDPNRALWLATRAGKMEPSCPLGTTRCVPQAKLPRKPYNKSFIDLFKSFIINPLLTFLCEFMDLDFVSVHKLAKKELGNIQPSWPSNNPYVLTDICLRTAMSRLVNLILPKATFLSAHQLFDTYRDKYCYMKAANYFAF